MCIRDSTARLQTHCGRKPHCRGKDICRNLPRQRQRAGRRHGSGQAPPVVRYMRRAFKSTRSDFTPRLCRKRSYFQTHLVPYFACCKVSGRALCGHTTAGMRKWGPSGLRDRSSAGLLAAQVSQDGLLASFPVSHPRQRKASGKTEAYQRCV